MKNQRAWVVLLLALWVRPALAQGAGASVTGAITGEVRDGLGGVLPGLSITLRGASLMGIQQVVASEQGIYRFPAVPPGIYRLEFRLPGFATLIRDRIVVTIGFTAVVNVELVLSSLEETVNVNGESPVVDPVATRVQNNFDHRQLDSLPNARDMTPLLAVVPGVAVNVFDVGGNTAGSQGSLRTYGPTGQSRALLEGINISEGSGFGLYLDYGSFEEVFVGTGGQGAEMPHSGVLSQIIGKSGGNEFQGEIYLDYENNDCKEPIFLKT